MARKATAVQFGAGAIGRGFMGELFTRAGLEVVFIDVAPAIVEAINRRRSYPLRFVGPDRYEEVQIAPVRAIDGRCASEVSRAVADAAIACTAVGAAALPLIAPVIARGLELRRDAAGQPSPLNILLCENRVNCAAEFREQIRLHLSSRAEEILERTGLVETVVSRMVPPVPPDELAADPLLVLAEDYERLPVSAPALQMPCPDIPGLQPVADLAPLAARKLYVHNATHAAAAYLGALAGYRYIHESLEDSTIRSQVAGAMAEASGALVSRFRLSADAMAAHCLDLMRRFRNPQLMDTAARVGRDPVRKLQPEERLLGALRLCLEAGIPGPNLLAATVAAFRFMEPSDPSSGELQAMLTEQGIDGVLQSTCGLEPGDPLYSLVRGQWQLENG